MNWYHQYMPGDMWDYDEAGSHILIDGVDQRPAAQDRHPCGAQRLSVHVRARQRPDHDGQALCARSQLDARASTRRPACRSTTIPIAISRSIPAVQNSRRRRSAPRSCARHVGRQQLLPAVLQPEDGLRVHPVHGDVQRSDHGPGVDSRRASTSAARSRAPSATSPTSSMADPITGEVKKRAHSIYPNVSGVLSTARRPRLHRLHRRQLRRL